MFGVRVGLPRTELGFELGVNLCAMTKFVGPGMGAMTGEGAIVQRLG